MKRPATGPQEEMTSAKELQDMIAKVVGSVLAQQAGFPAAETEASEAPHGCILEGVDVYRMEADDLMQGTLRRIWVR